MTCTAALKDAVGEENDVFNISIFSNVFMYLKILLGATEKHPKPGFECIVSALYAKSGAYTHSQRERGFSQFHTIVT